jgi:hypothetical protein
MSMQFLNLTDTITTDNNGQPPQLGTNAGSQKTVAAVLNTTNATPGNLTSVATATDSDTFLEAHVSAHRTNGTNEGAAYIRRVRARNNGGVVTISPVQDGFTSETTAAWDCTWVVSGTALNLQVTGAAANNITWTGYVSYTRSS